MNQSIYDDFDVNPPLRLPVLLIVVTGFLLLMNPCCAQDYGWWNVKHKWDGTTPWHHYIALSPAYMGPNALPVPILKNGRTPSTSYLKIGLESHASPGDRTYNVYTAAYISLFEKRVGLILQMVPIEYYQMDTMTRDARKARDYDGEGFSTGDLYIGSYFQIISEKKYWPDILLTINLRTASGNNLSAARFTDTPGYYFDMSLGKDFSLKNSIIETLRPFVTGGFYVWQTYRSDYHQNDALLFGAGIDLAGSKFTLSNSVGGYKGYIGNGDRPLIYRLILESHFNHKFNFEVRYQHGLRDMPTHSLRLMCRYDFFRKNKRHSKNRYFQI